MQSFTTLISNCQRAGIYSFRRQIAAHQNDPADHGRGGGLEQWKNHDKDIDGAENIWIAVVGPDTPALGEMKNIPRVTQSQIAATIAALLGQDYRASDPAAAPPLPVVAGWTN